VAADALSRTGIPRTVMSLIFDLDHMGSRFAMPMLHMRRVKC
jgi:hypothetical protein